MNDPHVVALFYNVDHGQSVDYQKAEPRDYEEDNFSIRVMDAQGEVSLEYLAEECSDPGGGWVRVAPFSSSRVSCKRVVIHPNMPEASMWESE